ncbi:MAG: hypothetical protein JWO25_3288 [Alphaproteobacteria bacterium]|nr:hypothetical protein [Alphaproteobacteria bacterium]MDB5723117.1 hypothetical protein [Alphaproteobacteria bacterium]
MSYVDGFVIPVPTGHKQQYREMAARVAPFFLEFGAERVVECWGDDVPHGKSTDFYGAVKAEEGENIVFAWVLWPSREVRDAGHARMMTDERTQPPADAPFDMKRMIFGGFEIILDESK